MHDNNGQNKHKVIGIGWEGSVEKISTVYSKSQLSKMTSSSVVVLTAILLLLTAIERTASATTNSTRMVDVLDSTIVGNHSSSQGASSGRGPLTDRQDNDQQVFHASPSSISEGRSSYQHQVASNIRAFDAVIAGLRLQRQKAGTSDGKRYLGSGQNNEAGNEEIRENSLSKLLFKRSIADDEAAGIRVKYGNNSDNSEITGVLKESSATIPEAGDGNRENSEVMGRQRTNDVESTGASTPRKHSSLSTEFPGDLSPLSKTSEMVTVQSKASNELGCRFGMNERRLLSISDHKYDRVTCFWCYVFVPKHRKKQGLKLDFRNHKFMYNNDSFAFEYNNVTTWQIVQESMIDDLEARKLEGCCKEAIECCGAMLQEGTAPVPSEGTAPPGSCPATWDGWSCLAQPASALHSVKIECPVHAYTGYPECYMTGKKQCGEGGVWQDLNGYEFTNYTGCSMKDFHQMNYIWEATMHSISLVALVPALLILCCYRALRLPRFKMHVNFFIALSLRGLFKILELTIIKIPENLNESTILEDNGIGCKVMVTLSKVALLSVWGWMMAESIFLHRLISRPFSRVTTILPYVAGAWGGAGVIGGAWAVCRALLEDFQCWLGDRKGDALQLHLVTDIPIMVSLLINIGLLIDMGRIMYLQLRGRNTDQSDVNKRAVKGTLFLLPMFGAQFLLTAVAPIGVQCSWLQGYLMISTALTGLQGFYITIFYCYNNNEVQKQLRLTTYRLQHRLCPSTLESSVPGGRRWGDSSAVDPQTTMSTVMSENSTTRGEGTVVEMQPLRG